MCPVDFLHILFLAFVQGITEFLPISSSAHLALAPYIDGMADQGLSFDVAIHVGSLLAVILYFRHDVLALTVDTTRHYLMRGPETNHSHLGKHIIIATLPIVVIGAATVGFAMDDLRHPVIIGLASILFGLLLWYSDWRGEKNRTLDSMKVTDALLVGLLQAFAIIPGTSRSGITITAGLLLGYKAREASRFSFFLAIPTILLSGVLMSYKLISGEDAVDWGDMLIGAVLSFLFAWLAIHWFLKLLDRTGMLPYVIYRVILGAILLILFL